MSETDKLIVFKNRTNRISVSLGIDVSGDILTSEIRTITGVLIATWDVEFESDGIDGELLLTLDNSVTELITYSGGLMDMKRVSGGEPLQVFDPPIDVVFREVVTQ